MTYYIVQTPQLSTPKDIYAAEGARGFIENNELHLISTQLHYVYKFTGNAIGWYMRNKVSNIDYYLGEGASPTIELDNLITQDVSYWTSIIATAD